MTTLLVANRGEIAIRILRTASRLDMRTVAVYSDADADAPHVRAADTAVRIGEAPATDSYLRRDRIVEAAHEAGATLVHPGYGFLAEDHRFAAACEAAGLGFVGPPSVVLETVGDKASARAIAQRAGVPVLDGATGDEAELVAAAERIGFPVLVKPAAGGGGKGMAVVSSAEELQRAIEAARRIAVAAFGDDRLVLERYVEAPRHVEVQILADTHGHAMHLFERDCSLQRRHQKILEEAPAPNLEASVRAQLHDAAVAFAHEAGYVGAGTCEFLVAADGTFGFIECNARLQVEHPVTEATTGLDLVELQLRVAQGEALSGLDVEVRGHAIEARVYAEDPASAFLPQAGRVTHVRWPDDVRVDAAVEEGTDVTTFYDPMLAKLIASGPDRGTALRALTDALASTELLGVRTNLAFLHDVVADPVVVEGRVTTDWLEERAVVDRPAVPDVAVAIAAAAEAEAILVRPSDPDPHDPWTSLGPWRAGDDAPVRVVVRAPDERTVAVAGRGPFDVDGLTIARDGTCHGWTAEGRRGAAARSDAVWHVFVDGETYELATGPAPRRIDAVAATLEAPLPGRVIRVAVQTGDHVDAGAELVVIEAMKMEHAITAPAPGTVTAVRCTAGDGVERGQALVELEPDDAKA